MRACELCELCVVCVCGWVGVREREQAIGGLTFTEMRRARAPPHGRSGWLEEAAPRAHAPRKSFRLSSSLSSMGGVEPSSAMRTMSAMGDAIPRLFHGGRPAVQRLRKRNK